MRLPCGSLLLRHSRCLHLSPLPNDISSSSSSSLLPSRPVLASLSPLAAPLERPLTHKHTRAPQGAGGVVRRRSRGGCSLYHSRPPRRKLCLATDKGTTPRPLPRYCRRPRPHACPASSSSRQHDAPTLHSLIKTVTKPSTPHIPCVTIRKTRYILSDKPSTWKLVTWYIVTRTVEFQEFIEDKDSDFASLLLRYQRDKRI